MREEKGNGANVTTISETVFNAEVFIARRLWEVAACNMNYLHWLIMHKHVVWIMEVREQDRERERERLYQVHFSRLLISFILSQSFQSVDLIFSIVCLSSASMVLYTMSCQYHTLSPSLSLSLSNTILHTRTILILLITLTSHSNCISFQLPFSPFLRPFSSRSNQSLITWYDAKNSSSLLSLLLGNSLPILFVYSFNRSRFKEFRFIKKNCGKFWKKVMTQNNFSAVLKLVFGTFRSNIFSSSCFITLFVTKSFY